MCCPTSEVAGAPPIPEPHGPGRRSLPILRRRSRFGNRGHQASRYAITVPGSAQEQQSSSGIIIATGTGSTGWSLSIASDRDLTAALPSAASDRLRWYIREVWPSPSTRRSLTDGTLTRDEHLEFVVQSDSLVPFGDGIEADHLTVDWSQKLTVGTSSRTLTLA